MIPDAEFTASYAARLFAMLTNNVDVMERQANSSERRFSKYELCRDMERNPQFYEAACFYLAVKQSEEESSHLKNVSKKSCAKKDAKSVLAKDEGGNGTMEEEEDDGDDDRPLNELDVIRAANLLEGTFKDVLDVVRDWTAGVSISLDVLPGGSGDKTIQAGEMSCASTKTLFQVAVENDGRDSSPTTNPVDYVFEHWKQKILQDAKTSVMEKIKDEDDTDWLTIAADEELHKAGL